MLTGHGLSVALPDGTPLFSNLDCSFGPERTGLTGRNGIGKTTLLQVLAGTRTPSQGYVVRNGVVFLLDQLAFLRSYPTIAAAFGREEELAAYGRVLEGRGTPDDLDQLDGSWDLPDRIEAALARVGLEGFSPAHPYTALSGGEQTRVQFARLLLDEPDFVLLDEPTNHLDREARAFVYQWVRDWRNGLIVVSHDRTLLDLMDRTAYLDERGLHVYGGNFTFFQEQSAAEREAAEADLHHARKELRKSRENAQRARERQEQRQASGKLHVKKTGISLMAAGILKRRGEVTAGKLKDVHADRIAEAEQALQRAKEAVVPDRTIHIDLSSTAVPSRRRMVELRAVNVRLGDAPLWNHPVTLSIMGPERVAIAGRNGSGKSTLLHLIEGTLDPSEGERYLGAQRVAFLDQRVAVLDPEATLLENVRRAAPERPEHELRLLLARFLFRAGEAEKPCAVLSGGERMRAGLACLLCRDQAPDLLLLDEPTNNLDFQSVEEIVSVLQAFQGTLIVVSHDEAFLRDVGVERVIDLDEISESGDGLSAI